MEKVVFISGKRTPFGAYGGSLKNISGTELGVIAAKATLEQAGVSPEEIDQIIMGNVVQSSSDGAYLARHIGLKIGLPVDRGAFIVNRLCGSGFQSWINAVQMIRDQEGSAFLAGGVEQMSQVPYVVRGVRFGGIRMGHSELEDFLTAALTDSYVGLPMAMTAEKLGEKYGITRDQVDQFSIQSQKRYHSAQIAKKFEIEMTSVKISNPKGDLVIDKDEHPKPEVTLEKVSAMKSLFKKEGLVTAATASGIVDGAACSLLMSESKARALKLKPLARIVSYASVGCDPSIMGIGPVRATQEALRKAGLTLAQIDLIEVNEAFAAQYLAVEKELGFDPSIANVNGGAIAVGHPLGASGTRIMNHLVYELQRTQKRYALGSACIGGGQGVAIIIERM